LPLAVLATVIVAAVVVRAGRSRQPAVEVRPSLPLPTAPLPASGLSAPLVAREPGADAAAPPHAPRMIHGGPHHRHRSGARGPARVKVGWRALVGGAVAAQVTTSPDEQTLYVATFAGSLVALARSDGTRRWEVPLGERVYSTPLVHEDGTIYVGSDAKKLVAITPEGRVLWRLEVEGEVDSGAAFTRDGNIVFAAGSNVYCVRRGGDLAWRFRTRGKVFTAPAVTGDDIVVFGAQDDLVRGISAAGALAWATDLGADVDGAPAVADDGAVYVGTDKGEVVRLDARGAVVWRAAVGGFVRGVLSVSRSGDVLAGTYGPVPRVVRIGEGGTVRGAFAIAGTGAREFGIHGGPLEDAEGTLFFGAQDDAVRAIGPDGSERWRFATGGDVDAPLTLLSDGALVVPSEDASVTMLLP